MSVSLNVLVLLVAAMAALPAAQSEVMPEAGPSEIDELGSLIQTAAEGKAARASSLADLSQQEFPAKAAREPMNFCPTGGAGGKAKATREPMNFCPTGGAGGKAADVAADAALAKVALGGSPAAEAPPEPPASQEEAPESTCPVLALVVAVALGTFTARGILTVQSGSGGEATLEDSLCVRKSSTQSTRVPEEEEDTAPSSASLLLDAARAGDADRVAELLKLGATANKADDWGCTPLHVASSVGDAKVVRVLLDGGADADAREAWEETPLHLAARGGSAEVCGLLLARGAVVDPMNSDDQTPLLAAAWAGKRAACEALLDHGAGAGEVSEEDLPPLLASLLAGRCLAACFGERN